MEFEDEVHGANTAAHTVPHYETVGMTQFGSTLLRELQGVHTIQGAPLIECFPSGGVTSVIASSFLVAKLKLPLVAVLSNPKSMPCCTVEAYIPTPALRIYGDARCVVLCGELPLPPDMVPEVMEAVFDFIKRYQLAQLVVICSLALEAIDRDQKEQAEILKSWQSTHSLDDLDHQHSPPPSPLSGRDPSPADAQHVRYITNHPPTADALQKRGHTPFRQGFLQGITGVTVAEMPFRKVPITVLMAPVSSMFPDTWGALQAVQTLTETLKLPLSTADLEAKAEKLEKRLKGQPMAGMYS